MSFKKYVLGIRIMLSSSHRNASNFTFLEPWPSFSTLSVLICWYFTLCVPWYPLCHWAVTFLECFKVKFLIFFSSPPIGGKPSSLWTHESPFSFKQKEICTDDCDVAVWHLAGQSALGEHPASLSTGISCHLWDLFPVTFANPWRFLF